MADNKANGGMTWFWIAILGVLVYSQYQGNGGCQIVNPIAPISEPGLHVLYLYKSQDLRTATKELVAAVNSNRVPDYVKSKNGKFERFDISVEQKALDKVWVDAMARPHPDLPWVIVSNAPARGGYEGKLLPTDDDNLALVKKFAE